VVNLGASSGRGTSWPQVFRSDVTGGLYVCVALSVVLPTLHVLFPPASNCPPAYDVLAMLAIIPMACAALLYGAKLVWPVKVYADGLRCYDESGRYHTVNWHDIQ
jgi:hypothetical protein